MISDALKLSTIMAAVAGLSLGGCGTRSKSYEILVTTYDGNSYVAGSGTDCSAAYEGAVIPADWAAIVCQDSL